MDKMFKDVRPFEAKKTGQTVSPNAKPVKIRNYVCHYLTDRPHYYSPTYTAKWTRMWIKAALLLDLLPIADNIENMLFTFMRT